MSNNNVICTICAERYRNSDNIHAGSCGHVFHEECLFRWRDQSRTCPICRSEDAAYFQLYLSFEHDGAGGGVGGSGRNQSQDNSTSSSSSSSSTASKDLNSGLKRKYETLLYEKDLYQQEIEYLNDRIDQLTLSSAVRRWARPESDSDTD
ncbi:hypothetical protein KR038_006784 [Drosophila bunnanda]|nr:hypothetical protein KR038_006784 [Drosophila bunnanda]